MKDRLAENLSSISNFFHSSMTIMAKDRFNFLIDELKRRMLENKKQWSAENENTVYILLKYFSLKAKYNREAIQGLLCHDCLYALKRAPAILLSKLPKSV